MTTALIQAAFSTGELSPNLFGRVDLAEWHMAAATMRNLFVNYRGGASSRAGTKFIGRSRQSGMSAPPRLIPFRFSINQSYALEFGEKYIRILSAGGFVTEAAKTITGITQSNPGTLTIAGHGFVNNDWVSIAGVGGTTALNNRIFAVANATANTFTLVDMFGMVVSTLTYGAFTSGGTAARIYTIVSPYLAADLPALKFTQSADVMTLTHKSYAPYDLTRLTSNSWTLVATTFAAALVAPGSVAASANVTSGTVTQYQYVVTAVNAAGEESIGSSIVTVTNSVQLSSTAGSSAITWAPVAGAFSYNIYKAPPSYNDSVPLGTIFGYIGTALGCKFVDTNTTPDFTRGPPLHLNPFAPGAISSITMTNGGTGFTSAPTITVNSSTGTGAVLQASIVIGTAPAGGPGVGIIQAIIVLDGGHDFTSADTITISGGGGSGATATLTVGPLIGTYPGVCAYFQQRRVYAGTVNNPDTYWMTQPGYYVNMDQGVIPIASDALEGTPWAQQVNGIQALVPMPGGLVTFTGLGVWQVSGQGGPTTPITPDAQGAQPQAANGCHSNIQPIPIGYDILYVQTKGAIVRDISYSFYANIYTGADLSVISDHLFSNNTINEWAWSEEPNKIVWAIRDDGTLLSLTYYKEATAVQSEKPSVVGWARHDTNGQFISVCSISEPPVDALYFVILRYVQGQWLYFIERMDNRVWQTIEDTWCVDAGLALTQTSPAAILTMDTATGVAGIGSASVTVGGTGYVAPSIEVFDPTGTGATFSITLVAGVITAVTVVTPGSGYTSPRLLVVDAVGVGAILAPAILDSVTLTASAQVFGAGNVGDVIRAGGGLIQITSYFSPTIMYGNILSPVLRTLPNDPANTPVPQVSGAWTMTTPVTQVSGLQHLEGKTVSILADGNVVAQQVVTNGAVTLDVAASSIVVGLPFQAQLQSLYTDIPGEATVQGKRKNIFAVIVRVKDSRGIKVGSNQIDASVQPQTNPITWLNMVEIKQNNPTAGLPIPLFTGDQRVVINPKWAKPGQVAMQQDYPLPMNILSIMPEVVIGDSNSRTV